MKRLDQTDAYLALCGAASVAVIAVALLSSSLVVDGAVVTNGARSSAPVVSTVPSPARSDAPAAAPLATVGGGVNSPAVAQTPTPPQVGNAGIALSTNETAQTLTTEQWHLIAAAFPDRVYTMARIAFCESRFKNVVGEGKYLGWFQIDPAHLSDRVVVEAWGGRVEPAERLMDPVFNVLTAATLVSARPDLGDWPRTRNGCPEWNS